MLITRHIPNVLTSAGLLSGCLGIVAVSEGLLSWTPYFVIMAGFFDFVDGFAARALKVSSPMGKELDSLSDMVSFGVLPAFFMFKLLQGTSNAPFIPYIAFLVAIASAWRLAYFNVDDRQGDRFIGLPTPANALFFSGLILIPEHWFMGHYNYALILIVLIFSWLLNANVELIALKFAHFKWKGNEPKFIVMLLTLFLFVSFGMKSISLVIVTYLLVSILSNYLIRR